MNEIFNKLGNEPTAVEINAKAKELASEGHDVVSLAVGEPDFPTPEPIKHALLEALESNLTFYPNPQGVPELREVIARYESKRKGVDVDPDEILITVGGKPVIAYTLYLLCNPGDEVVLVRPYYLAYPYWIKVFNLRMKTVDSIYELPKFVSDRTKVIILNYPNNPTGKILSKEELDVVLEVLEKHDVHVLSDEVYSHIIYEGEHVSPFSYRRDRVILLESFSKTFSMTGWRLGYGIFPRWMVRHLVKFNSNMLTGPTTFVQYAGIRAIEDEDVWNQVKSMVLEFRKRRDYMYERLRRIEGMDFSKPQGAFYYFIRIPGDGMEFSRKFLEEEYVAITPGIIFGVKDAVRLSFAVSLHELEKAMDRFESFYKRYFS